ncbi:hypothetical protein [Thermococcus sp. GR6]|uniref:hypothetical protein n=1 Tax=Thermococcus sp. GR6 TaxID=1638256 RepID=UPI001430DA37|nr:hypothetical protein [Thermococcus sp. GR6]NJE42648.1 hypothetical protein [Thermococcus sp. GR6]
MDMKKKSFLTFLLMGIVFFSLFFYFNPLSEPKESDQAYEYSVDEMYARHSFSREFGKFDFWDLISKKDIDRIRSQVKNGYMKSEELFYDTGIYTWPLYSSYAWDAVESNISCPRNMTHERFYALIRNISPKYEKLRNTQEYYLRAFRNLESEVTEPRAYALLAWLELLLVDNHDLNYDEYAREYGFSEDVCRSLLGLPEYYENYVFPYVELGIRRVIELNSGSSSDEILSEKARIIIQNRGDSLGSELVLINKTKQGSLEAYGAYGLTYYSLSKNLSTRGFNSLALFYFSWAEGYYNISKDDVAKVPMRLDYPFNVSKIRDMVYSETNDLLNQLHRNNFYTLDPLISQVVLYHIARVDYTVLPKLQDRNSELYFMYPSEVYTEYLRILAKIRGVEIFYEHLVES